MTHPDTHPIRGFHPAQGSEADRPYRTQTEPLAELPESYIYNFNRWQDFSYPGDMWNEPVLMFRADAVYDRGNEYATTTMGGHKLTLVKEFPLDYMIPNPGSEKERIENENQTVSTFYTYKATIWAGMDRIYEDGRQYRYPDWMSVWMRH